MERNKIIKLANKVGLSAYNKHDEFSIAVIDAATAVVCTDEILKLIELVGKEILENAAKVCSRLSHEFTLKANSETVNNGKDYVTYSAGATTADLCAWEIRKLKENHGQ